VTDDTGIVDPGAWEILYYASYQHRESARPGEAPGLEATVGLVPRIDLTAALPGQFMKEDGSEREFGWGSVRVGGKWLAYERAGAAVAIAPTLALPVSSSSTIRGLIDDTVVFDLLLIASLEGNRWQGAVQAVHQWNSQDFNSVFLGGWVGYSARESILLLAEVWGVEFLGDVPEVGVTNWAAGVD
jgi:hypothetical protein